MEAVASPPATSPGANGVGATTTFAAVDPVRVVEHLTVLLEAALGATRTELEAPGSLLSTARYPETLLRCTRFAGDGQALYVQKDLVSTETVGNEDAEGMIVAGTKLFLSGWRGF